MPTAKLTNQEDVKDLARHNKDLQSSIRENGRNRATFIVLSVLMLAFGGGSLLMTSPVTPVESIITGAISFLTTSVVFASGAAVFHYMIKHDKNELNLNKQLLHGSSKSHAKEITDAEASLRHGVRHQKTLESDENLKWEKQEGARKKRFFDTTKKSNETTSETKPGKNLDDSIKP